ncbi:MAG: ATP-binding cassette domain-containing protein [Spirochaetaceae bacterium]|jgi:D-methionine transport system ATP-binding protein|nr:ATP-binding cassette domain-containing protein [Spirochaetaceae bacterium]
MIQLVDVDKTFHIPAAAASDGKPHTVHAVQKVSLSIEAGDIFGVIGFSGAGKSTLVRCINLLERPDGGKVLVDGEDLTSLSTAELRHRRKKIGMIFQHFNLFRSRTVGGNVAFSLKYTGMKKEALRGRVRELLELVGLSDKEHAYPSQLSGGQKQRVGIARALASNPRVLLCDEATSALDPQTTRSILSLLKELNKKLGLTIVIITHEMQVIKTICSHAAVMDQGMIVEQGPVFDIFSNPQKQITRDFVAATSHLYKIYDLLEEASPVIKLQPGQMLAHFSYRGRNTVDALISTASIKFNVKLNIIFGDLDIIQDTPIGGLIIIMEGEKDALEETIRWFTGGAVTVEILKRGEENG